MLRNPVFLYGCCLILLACLASAKVSNAQLRLANGRQAEELGQPIPKGYEPGINHDSETFWLLIKLFSGLIGLFAALFGSMSS